ncbi:hypothetical protein, variant [Aphanomyces invadans]|uniref:Uncharacterized protein n=1 Tax=Aphanomyces invadans TaxID=157072 RepID=A0A024TNX8_9STRA|nr:hypothetical protein, variant [Aphanomyces invadans]ETV95047.1 hypothetical protein, variant [Aphanomyces invadans]|eukprot:XP_008876219.1 hypothetical protein, variant [Aphanomyces invadans]
MATRGDGGRQVLTIKDISTKNAQQLRHDALRLVLEGVVQLEVDVHASYERQGNMAYYSEENLARRLAIRNHPLLQRLTCALWRLVCRTSSPMDFDGYTTLLIRLHKILMEHFDADMSFVQIQHDWDSDTKGKAALSYAEFHLALFELVDIWCDSIHVADYISLLYLILEGITRVDSATFKLRPLEEILYTDVVDAALQRTVHDIESIMATMIIEPVDAVPDGKAQVVASSTQLDLRCPLDREQGIDKAATDTEARGRTAADVAAVADAMEGRSGLRSIADSALSAPAQSHAVLPPASTAALPPDRYDPVIVAMNPNLHMDSPPRPLALDDSDRHLLTSLPSLAPWGDDPPTLPRCNGTPKSSTLQTASDSSLCQMQPSTQSHGASPVLEKHASMSRLLPDSQRLVAASQPAPGRGLAKLVKETAPLDQREFGGFKIKSSRDLTAPVARPKPVLAPIGVTLVGALTKATLPAEDSNANRIDEIRKAFQNKPRQSFVRKRTPPRLGILDTKPPVAPATAMPTNPAANDSPAKLKRKATEIHKESSELVADLAPSTPGAGQLDAEASAMLPPNDIDDVHSGNPPRHAKPPPSHDVIELAAHHLAMISQLPPRPAGATKHLLPRRYRRIPALDLQAPPVEAELRASPVRTPQRPSQAPHLPAARMPLLLDRPTLPQLLDMEKDAVPSTFQGHGPAVVRESKSLQPRKPDTTHQQPTTRTQGSTGQMHHTPPPGIAHNANESLPVLHHHPSRSTPATTTSKALDEARLPLAVRVRPVV